MNIPSPPLLLAAPINLHRLPAVLLHKTLPTHIILCLFMADPALEKPTFCMLLLEKSKKAARKPM